MMIELHTTNSLLIRRSWFNKYAGLVEVTRANAVSVFHVGKDKLLQPDSYLSA